MVERKGVASEKGSGAKRGAKRGGAKRGRESSIKTPVPLSSPEDAVGGATNDFYHTAAWQVVEERVNDVPRRQYVWSPVYVDALVLRDRDANNDGSLEERLWAAQDANYNVTAVFDNSGNVVERYVYDPYGTPTVYDATYANVLHSAEPPRRG